MPDTSSRTELNRTARHNEWLQLYAGGATMAEIGRRYNVTRVAVHEVIHRALTGAESRRAELAEHALELQLERYEMIYRAHMPIALNASGGPDAAVSARIVLQTMDRQNKLLGLEAPQQVETTVRVLDGIDEEVMRLAEQLKRNATGVDTPALDAITGDG